MRTVSQRPASGPGRWVWAVAGLITAVFLVIPGTRLIDFALRWHAEPPGTSVSAHPTPTSAGRLGTVSGNVSVHATPVSAPWQRGTGP